MASPHKPARAKVNRKGRNPHQRFIGLPHYMLNSPAWKTMSPNAKALLLAVWRRHNGINNGEISYAVDEAAEIGMSSSVAARAFVELQDRGFLKVARQSSFNLKNKLARTWILTAERYRGEPPTRDFMKWQPPKRTTKKTEHGPPGGTVGPPGGNRPPDKHRNETILPFSVPHKGPSRQSTVP